MTSKTVDKSAKSSPASATRRAAVKNAKAARVQATANTLARKLKSVQEEQSQDRPTKNALLLQLLNRPDGASIEDMMHATEWQQHSVRGFLAGTVKKMGLALTSIKAEGDVRRYRISTRRGR